MEIALDQKKKINLTCDHCGDTCPSESISLGESYFCCEGCKMVYEILHEHELGRFYQIEKKAGISLKDQKKGGFSYLDDPEIIEALVQYSDEQLTKVSFYLPQIHCASCVWLLENLFKLNDGILSSRVQFLKRELRINFDPSKISIRQIVELLDTIGYTPDINLSQLKEEKKKAVPRRLYYQIGLAGFVFGNIMLLSFPEYLGLSSSVFGKWFGYLNLLLILPSLLYSGSDYLRSAWFGIKQRNLNIDVPIAIGMLTLFLRSTYEIISHTGAGYLDSLAGLIFFLLIGKWFQQKTYHNLSFERDYKAYFPIAATIEKEKEWVAVPLDQVKKGDVLLIKNQELIPVDGLLIEGNGLLDYSFVTGESEPVRRSPGDKLYAGGKQQGQSLKLSVTKSVSQSYLTQLWNENTFKTSEQGTASRLADTFGTYFTFGILIIAFSTLAYWLPKDVSIGVNAFTAVLIIACPCAIALAIPFAYGNVLRILARQQFFIKNTNVIERIQSINSIVLDKTGTLTEVLKQSISYLGKPLSEVQKTMIYSLTSQSNHPKSKAIAAHFSHHKQLAIEAVEELPGLGLKGSINGQEIRIGSGKLMIPVQNGKGVYIQIGKTVLGNFRFRNFYRRGLSYVIQQLKHGYRLAVLSGDNAQEKEALIQLFPEGSKLLFNQQPIDKLNFIKKGQEAGDQLLMIGDGLNDAGALKQSEVGLVITEDTNNFTPASDIIMSAKQFEKLPLFLSYLKRSRYVIYAAYFFALIYNAIGLSFAVKGLLSPVIAAILMPLSSVSIVLLGIVGSQFIAWQMGLYSVNDKDQPKE